MAASRSDLFARLDRLGIAHRTVDHPAIFTVDEGRDLKQSMPGGHSKNLFLKDKGGNIVLVACHCDTRVDLTALGKAFGSKGRYSFGKPELLQETLGVPPGSVTPFALINATGGALKAVIIDDRLRDFDPIWFHPLENTASTAISFDGLIAFVRDAGFEPHVLALPG